MLRVCEGLRDHVKRAAVGQHQVLGAGVCRASRIASPYSTFLVSPGAVLVGAIICRRAEIQQVARTVRRTPEVMVKVLPKSANTLTAVRKHLGYIGRKGELDLETDDGERLRGARAVKALVEDWDLDLDEYRRKSDLTASAREGAGEARPQSDFLDARGNTTRQGSRRRLRISPVRNSRSSTATRWRCTLIRRVLTFTL